MLVSWQDPHELPKSESKSPDPFSLPRRVIKLGGSLLNLSDLVPRLRRWLAMQSEAENLMLVGGGRLADVIRDVDRQHGLGQQVGHWLCVRAMVMGAEILAALLPEAGLVSKVAPLASQPARPRLVVIDPWTFMRDDEPRLTDSPLPASWAVTSDSIAARLATLTGAAELVLLKSALPQQPATIQAAVATDFVDAFFSQAAAGIPAVRCVDLRSDDFPQVRLLDRR